MIVITEFQINISHGFWLSTNDRELCQEYKYQKYILEFII